jgi:hypothetical protein
VEVNGDLFATITVTGDAPPVIVGADGQPLSEAEQAALLAIWYMFAEGFFFEDLNARSTERALRAERPAAGRQGVFGCRPGSAASHPAVPAADQVLLVRSPLRRRVDHRSVPQH